MDTPRPHDRALADARDQGYTWDEIAMRLATTPSAARHRHAAYARSRHEALHAPANFVTSDTTCIRRQARHSKPRTAYVSTLRRHRSARVHLSSAETRRARTGAAELARARDRPACTRAIRCPGSRDRDRPVALATGPRRSCRMGSTPASRLRACDDAVRRDSEFTRLTASFGRMPGGGAAPFDPVRARGSW